MTRRKILLDLRERRFRGQRALVGDEFWGYTLTREDVDIVKGKGSLPMEEETEKLCVKCWREEVTGIDTTAPGQADEITRPGGLRDQFAMAALTGLCAAVEWQHTPEADLADMAYWQADAMLEARKK